MIETIKFRSLDKAKKEGGFCWQQNRLPKEYLPLIGLDGLGLYSVYSSVAVNGVAKIEQNTLYRAAQCGPNRVSDTAKMLHMAGIIIQLPAKRGKLIPVALPHLPSLDEKQLAKIRQRVLSFKGYDRLRDKLLKRIDEYKSLKQVQEEVRSKHVEEKAQSEFFNPPDNGSTNGHLNGHGPTNGHLNGHGPSAEEGPAISWGHCLDELGRQMTKATFQNLLVGSTAEYDETSATLAVFVGTDSSKQWLEARHLETLQRTASQCLDVDVENVVIRLKGGEADAAVHAAVL